jgi:hypothetical protein
MAYCKVLFNLRLKELRSITNFCSGSPEVSKLWGAPPGSAVGPLGGRVVCMRGIFILNEILVKDKMCFGRHCAWLKYEICFIV